MDICSLCANAVPLSTRRPVFALGSASRSGYETLPRVRRCASFVPRRRFDIVTTGGQQTIKIWTYFLKRDTQTLEGHTLNVSFAVCMGLYANPIVHSPGGQFVQCRLN